MYDLFKSVVVFSHSQKLRKLLKRIGNLFLVCIHCDVMYGIDSIEMTVSHFIEIKLLCLILNDIEIFTKQRNQQRQFLVVLADYFNIVRMILMSRIKELNLTKIISKNIYLCKNSVKSFEKKKNKINFLWLTSMCTVAFQLLV